MGVRLSVDGLVKEFGGLMAVAHVSFDVMDNQIKAIIGPNGAGKTTLLNMISGVTKPSSGRVVFKGIEVQSLEPHRLSAMGMSRTYQNIELFKNMSVVENVMVGCHLKGKAGFFDALLRLPWTVAEENSFVDRAMHWLDVVGLHSYAHIPAPDISFGRQRLLEIARALASEPSVILLDEVASGLSAAEKQDFASLIRRIKTQGISVLIVDHDMELVMELADEIVVVDYGVKIAEGQPTDIRNDARVIAAYLGEETSYAQAR